MVKTKGRYSRIKSRFWIDEKSGKWSNDQKLLALYLLSCPHGNMLGCFVLPKLYICADLRWDLDGLKGVFSSLLQEDFMDYDEQTNLVLVKNYLKHNPIENTNQAQAAIKVVNELPRSRLLAELSESVKERGKDFLNLLIEEIEQLLAKPLPEQFGEPSGEQLPKQNAEPVSVSVTVSETEDKDCIKGKTFDDNSIEMTLARRLRTRILGNLPNAKVPEDTRKGLQGWCSDFDLMIRKDKRTPDEIEQLIDWAQTDSFWQSNILSAGKLRKQFDRLTLERRRKNGLGENQSRTSSKNASTQTGNHPQRDYLAGIRGKSNQG